MVNTAKNIQKYTLLKLEFKPITPGASFKLKITSNIQNIQKYTKIYIASEH